jgi:hypothetical protein
MASNAEVLVDTQNVAPSSSEKTGTDNETPSTERQFKTIQEKVDSWTGDEDDLTMGLFRLDPPKPMGNLEY